MKKVASKLLTKQAKLVDRRSRGHASHVRQGTQGMLEGKRESSRGTLTSEYVGTKGKLTRQARKHSMHVST